MVCCWRLVLNRGAGGGRGEGGGSEWPQFGLVLDVKMIVVCCFLIFVCCLFFVDFCLFVCICCVCACVWEGGRGGGDGLAVSGPSLLLVLCLM